MKVLGVEERGEPYLFHLTAGKHELKLEVVLGDLADIVRRTEESLYEINRMYRSILAVTSAAPDPLRDYRLEKRVPKVIENLKVQSEVIAGLSRNSWNTQARERSHVFSISWPGGSITWRKDQRRFRD